MDVSSLGSFGSDLSDLERLVATVDSVELEDAKLEHAGHLQANVPTAGADAKHTGNPAKPKPKRGVATSRERVGRVGPGSIRRKSSKQGVKARKKKLLGSRATGRRKTSSRA